MLANFSSYILTPLWCFSREPLPVQRRTRMKPARSADILPTAGPHDTRVVLMLEGCVVDLNLIHGTVPLGYDVKDRRLEINKAEAKTVRLVFERFAEIGSATVLARELRADGVRTKQGKPVSKGYIYRLLNNRVYIGEAVHKGQSYPGQHKGIIPRKLWDKVHAILRTSPRTRASNTRAQTPALLKGLLFGPDGAAFSPSHTRKKDRLYRYYVSQTVLKHGAGTCPVWCRPCRSSFRATAR